jgi:hypothetical protein
MRVSVTADMSRALIKLQSLPAKVQDKALAQTVNEVTTRARTEMKRQISSEWNIKQSDTDNQLRVTKASAKKTAIEATLYAVGSNGSRNKRSRNVIFFDAKVVLGTYMKRTKSGKWAMVTSKDGGGVSVKISKKAGRKLLPHAFIGNKGRTVFERTPNGIKPLSTIDVPQMFNARRVNKAVVDKIREELVKSAQRSLDRFSRNR